jgi:hypothetical protein
MAGFLDPKERIIDMVLTDTGKQLLMQGNLHFVYWVPFDDEVDYSPPNPVPQPDQTVDQRRVQLLESPLVMEAKTGYKGLNYVLEDTTNVNRPMFTAHPGVGQTSPIPWASILARTEYPPGVSVFSTAALDAQPTGTVNVVVQQQKQTLLYLQLDQSGAPITQPTSSQTSYQRYGSNDSVVQANYAPGELPSHFKPEGFLVTMYLSTTLGSGSSSGTLLNQGGYEEVVHNRDSTGSIVYRNDLLLTNYTP